MIVAVIEGKGEIFMVIVTLSFPLSLFGVGELYIVTITVIVTPVVIALSLSLTLSFAIGEEPGYGSGLWN